MELKKAFRCFFKKFTQHNQSHSLNFLGRGSCFANDHNAAFFVTKDNDFVLIDCSEQTSQRLKNEFDLSTYNNIYVYITHTHGDHICGLDQLIHYAYFALNKQITVIAPSLEVSLDIEIILKLKGVEAFQYILTSTLELIPSLIGEINLTLPKNVFAISIPTTHTPSLNDRCFGYQFTIADVNIIYTGDTATLEPFIPYLNYGSELYVDTSVAFKSDVHLWLPDMLPTLVDLTKKGVSVYLMHLDDVKKAKKIIKNIQGIEVVQIV